MNKRVLLLSASLLASSTGTMHAYRLWVVNLTSQPIASVKFGTWHSAIASAVLCTTKVSGKILLTAGELAAIAGMTPFQALMYQPQAGLLWKNGTGCNKSTGSNIFDNIQPWSKSAGHDVGGSHTKLLSILFNGKYRSWKLKEKVEKKGKKEEIERNDTSEPSHGDKTLIVEEKKAWIENTSPYKSDYLKNKNKEKKIANW